MPAMLNRFRFWYTEARVNGHGRYQAARWAVRIASGDNGSSPAYCLEPVHGQA